MPHSRFITVPMLLLSQVALAAPPVSSDAPVSIPPGVVVGPGQLHDLPDLTPSVKTLATEIAQLRKDLKETQAQLAAIQADYEDHKKAFVFLTAIVNGVNQQLQTHQHTYTYETVDYLNREFVTSGRPIVKQEKRDFGSFIQGLHSRTGTTQSPTFGKQ